MGDIISINFRGDNLYGFKQDDGTFLAVKPMCEAMGLDWEPQRKRIYRDPVLAKGTSIMEVPFGRGGAQEAVCIKLELVNGFLFGIDSSRIKDEAVREKVILYQSECYQVLSNHFSGRSALMPPEVSINADASDSVRLRMVSVAGQYFGTRAAREMWFLQGLQIVPAMRMEQQADLFDPQLVRHPMDEAA